LLELRLRWLLIAGSTYAPTTNLTNGTATAAPEYGRIFARPEWAQTDAARATALTSFRTNDEASYEAAPALPRSAMGTSRIRELGRSATRLLGPLVGKSYELVFETVLA